MFEVQLSNTLCAVLTLYTGASQSFADNKMVVFCAAERPPNWRTSKLNESLTYWVLLKRIIWLLHQSTTMKTLYQTSAPYKDSLVTSWPEFTKHLLPERVTMCSDLHQINFNIIYFQQYLINNYICVEHDCI